MAVPQTDTGDVRSEAVLIPLRSLRIGKGRLADVLDQEERNVLIEEMARTVVLAAHDLDVLVVHDDPDVALWAAELGAQALRPPEPGLNEAIYAGWKHLCDLGYDRVIVTHADLPYAKDLRVMSTAHDVAIAPDRHRDGTNVLAVATHLDFTFAYGPGSFDRHVGIAKSLGVAPHIITDPALAWDVDTPDDLEGSPENSNPEKIDEETGEDNH